jgi:DnaJ-domain-containing protein 1
MGQCQQGQIGAAIMAGATAAQRLEEAHASPRNIRNLINEARNEGGWEGFRKVLDDIEPTQSPPSSQEDDASASDSDADEEAAAWWRREHGDAAGDAPAPAPARNRPAAADRQDDARWEGPTYDGDRQPPRRRPPPSSKRKTLYDVLGVAVNAPRGEVKRAYHALALRLHPDKCASPTANERFKAVQEAYATLGDRSRRAAYDAAL